MLYAEFLKSFGLEPSQEEVAFILCQHSLPWVENAKLFFYHFQTWPSPSELKYFTLSVKNKSLKFGKFSFEINETGIIKSIFIKG